MESWLVQIITMAVAGILLAVFAFGGLSGKAIQQRRIEAVKRRLDRRNVEQVDRRRVNLGPPGGVERRSGPRRGAAA